MSIFMRVIGSVVAFLFFAIGFGLYCRLVKELFIFGWSILP